MGCVWRVLFDDLNVVISLSLSESLIYLGRLVGHVCQYNIDGFIGGSLFKCKPV